jgi:hypothetical protein
MAQHWIESIKAQLTAIAEYYERSAPTVADWCNDLYIRIGEKPETVVLPELYATERFLEEGVWMQPNYAANAVYHLLNRLGRDTTGMAGY